MEGVWLCVVEMNEYARGYCLFVYVAKIDVLPCEMARVRQNTKTSFSLFRLNPDEDVFLSDHRSPTAGHGRRNKL